MIETAQKEFARQLPAQPYEGDLDRIDLMDLVKTLKQENDSLKRDLVSAIARAEQLEGLLGQARRSTPVQAATRVSPAPQTPQMRQSSPTQSVNTNTPSPSNVPRTYTVQSGDTLSAISKRFYGTPSRWIDIYQANRDRLSSESALRVGQEVRIP